MADTVSLHQFKLLFVSKFVSLAVSNGQKLQLHLFFGVTGRLQLYAFQLTTAAG